MSTMLFVLAKNESDAGGIVLEAAHSVLSETDVRPIRSVEKARATTPDSSGEFVVLIDPAREELAEAFGATDDCGLPRWPVLVLGSATGHAEDIEAIPRSEWNRSLLVHAFRNAMAQHASRRECARARGDLKTIGQRMTHDLRAQLGGILSAAELLQEILASGGSPKASQLHPIFESTDATVKLLERISFVTRATATPRMMEALNMGTVFWAALQRLESQIGRKRASLLQPPAWPNAMGVADWLEVVWWNLLSNALQHTGHEARITPGWEKAGSEYRFWLRDNGGGVPVEKRGLLFHPFHRLHEPNAPSGIGLSIVRRLVQLMGGRCGYEPLPEGGSSFYFTLPAAPERQNARS